MIDKVSFRNAVGQFATGVCLVGVDPEDAPPFAMTINSFSSLSLEPPLILWSIQKTSDCYEAVMAATQFTINILGREQKALASQYATKGGHALASEHFSAVPGKAPAINGAMVSLQCELFEHHTGGDHDIIVGRVQEIHRTQCCDQPLMFYNGGFFDPSSQ